MRMPTPARVWVSASLICVGLVLFPTYHHWLATRTWEPVKIPVSLAPGHLRTADFNVNLRRVFYFQIETEYSYDPDCQDYKVLQTRWWLSHDGQLVETWEGFWNNHWAGVAHGPVTGSYLGAFEGGPGRYSLDVEIAPGASCLQKYHPRLRVYADDTDYANGGWVFETTLFVSCLLVAVGAGFLGVSFAASPAIEVPRGESLAIFETLRVQREASRRKLALMSPGAIFPSLGYVYAVTCLVLFFSAAPFQMVKLLRSDGISARVLRRDMIEATMGEPSAGLLVYVDAAGKLYFDSEQVTPAELERALSDEFARRADWSVYVEGDPNATYQAVIDAADLVRAANGRVILLTPGMRAEAEAARHR